MRWQIWDIECYGTCISEGQRDRVVRVIEAMAHYKDPRNYQDGKGGEVKPLIGDLFGRYSYKPGKVERYTFKDGNFRIEFELWVDEEQVMHKQPIPSNPQQRVIKVIRAGARSAAYTS